MALGHLGVRERARPDAKFDFHPRPTQPTAWCSADDADTSKVTSRLADLYNRIMVTYTDPAAGVGQAEVNIDNPDLAGTGIGRDHVVNMGPGTASTARIFGQLVYTLLRLQSRAAGELTLPATVGTAAGPLGAHKLRAGKDRLRVTELLDAPWLTDASAYDFAVKRVEVTVGQKGVRTDAEIGQGADLMEVLNARLEGANAQAGVA